MATHMEEDSAGKKYDAEAARRLVRYLIPCRRLVIIALALTVLVNLVRQIGPFLTQAAIDDYVQPAAAHQLAPASAFDGIATLSLLYLLSLAVTLVISYFQDILLNTIGQRVMHDLREQIFRKFQALDVAWYDRNPVGRLITRLTSDVDALNELFTSGLIEVLGDVVLIIGALSMMIWYSWRLALVSLLVIPLLIAATAWFRRGARRGFHEVRTKIARLNAFTQEHLSGAQVIQLFNRESRAMAQFSEINAAHRQANIETIFYYAVFYPLVSLISAVGTASLVWYGGGQVIQNAITLGTLVAFLQYTQRLWMPIQDISDRYNILQAAIVASDRIFKLLDEPVRINGECGRRKAESSLSVPLVENGNGPQPDAIASALPGANHDSPFRTPHSAFIEFRHVWFAYRDEEWVLRDVSFTVTPGQSLAFVGATGSGKTTITNLLMRFYDIQRGAILLDGVDIREWPLETLRRKFAVVLQDVFLFSGDLAANIRLGNQNISDERIEWAARETRAVAFIDRLPDRFQARVMERGAGFSSGQKQLVSLTRALAFDPEILILDEATSSIDTETEQLIQQAIGRVMESRTSIIIAHRLSTIQRADRIIVLHKGEIREMGTHQELLARRGVYFRLYQLQYKEQPAAFPSTFTDTQGTVVH
ncbi:MAG: ABC transporter ATP-binding protein [Blastocatellia bacterium]